MVERFGSKGRRAAAGGAAVALAGLALSVLPAVLGADETVGLALLFAARGPVAPPDDVVLVSISRDSARGAGQSEEIDEWPRSLHAELVNALAAAGARAIAFDIIFEEPRADDDVLAAALERAGNVILVERVEEESVGSAAGGVRGVVEVRQPPVERLRAAALATAPFTLPKVPVRVSQFWAFGRASADTASLPAAAFQAFLLPAYDELLASIERERPSLGAELGAARAQAGAAHGLTALVAKTRAAFLHDPSLANALRADVAGARSRNAGAVRALIDLYGGSASRYLNFYGPPRAIRTIPFDVASSGAGSLDLRGKMVFVGFAEPRPADEDDFFYSVFSQRSGANLSGVEIGATAFANLLERRSVVPLSMPGHLLLVLGWGLLLGVVIGSPTRVALPMAALAAASYAAAAHWLFAAHSVWLPLLVPLFVQVPVAAVGAVLVNYVRLMRQRERVQRALGYYVPPPVAHRLAEQSVSAAANRQLLHGTCLFTDAEQYTTVSETLRPDDLAALMNEYYGAIFPVVERHGGMVSDASGDSMVAIWATAEPDASSRERACRAALELVAAVTRFNRGRGSSQLPTRVGLESGEVLLGNIGAEQRYEYRAIGDIVNTASRLQGLNRVLGTRILVSDATVAGAPGLAARALGNFLLRGKRTAVRVHEPLGFEPGVSAEARVLKGLFEAALASFEEQRWSDAECAFAEILARFPEDRPSAYYAALAAEYRRAPRAWIGAISVASK